MRNASAPADDEAGGAATEVGRPDRGSYVPQPRSAPAADSDDAPEAPEPPAPTSPADPALSDREREILAFEQRWWKHAGAKEQAIRDAFDISSTRYYQLLNGLLDNPAALAAEPMLVARLRRLRAARSRNRRR
ncbi:DUF3263 domain-containing protein [Plantactinospora soyae]|uniref:DUF3263 domain-containing protein n=1 Tax=Plantactinospora soyae TaxID=1544732 RepID=A0A927M1V9_9ACTN|nr:DUF3263 domain-containing protein [Plantactinospora soyae]MBE1486633.1 hypothetical protein [Plantactinospora soyae]